MSATDDTKKDNINTIAYDDRKVKYSADSVEFCPVEGLEQYFVCGNYQLVEATREKIGLIYLMEVGAEEGKDATQASPLSMIERQCVDTEAILDLKWCPEPIENKAILGEASADGNLHLYSLPQPTDTDKDTEATLVKMTKAQIGDGTEELLGLSLDWSNRVISDKEPNVVVSHSKGGLSLFQLTNQGAIKKNDWKGHDYEVWITAFNYWDPNVIYSGADDTKFKGWDLRIPLSYPTFQSNAHTMGVTVITANPHREHVIATGSYDEKLRIWDARNMRRPVDEYATGGGIWRLRWHPHHQARILAGCMHGGFHVIDTGLRPPSSSSPGCTDDAADTHTGTNTTTDVNAKDTGDSDKIETLKFTNVASYMEHNSLAYGCDWCYLPKSDTAQSRQEADDASVNKQLSNLGLQDSNSVGKINALRSKVDNLVASCSFYDNQLHMWRVEEF